MGVNRIVPKYPDRLGSQREFAFTAFEGLTHVQLWQISAPKEWSIGEILNLIKQAAYYKA